MADPGIASPETSWLGVKLAWLAAGFAGGVVSLSFVKALTPMQGVLAVFTGVASAAYGTPLTAQYMFGAQSSGAIENGIAFVIGLTAMNVIPGVLKLSEIFKRDPKAFIPGSGK